MIGGLILSTSTSALKSCTMVNSSYSRARNLLAPSNIVNLVTRVSLVLLFFMPLAAALLFPWRYAETSFSSSQSSPISLPSSSSRGAIYLPWGWDMSSASVTRTANWREVRVPEKFSAGCRWGGSRLRSILSRKESSEAAILGMNVYRQSFEEFARAED